MKTDKTINRNDIYLGYFAGVVLALLTSGWLADVFVTQLVKVVALEDANVWRVNIAAGLFFGVSFANPAGILISKTPVKRSLKFLSAGFIFGVVAQSIFFTPIAGAGMSNFLRLLTVGSVVPLSMLANQANNLLRAHGIEPKDAIAERVLAFMQWPDRVLFILLMGVSFAVFWRFTVTTEQVLVALGSVLTVMTVAIALRRPTNDDDDQDVRPDFQAWLDLEPEEPGAISLSENAMKEVRRLVGSMLPGAVLFGGMTRLAVDVLVRVYPNLQANLNDPDRLWQTLGIVAASGLGLVFFGILISLGFSLMLLQLIGRVRNWTNVHLRENCFYLLRTLYFRPMKRT